MDPVQAWTMLSEVAERLTLLDAETVDLLVRQTETLGFSDHAFDIAKRVLPLASSPEDKRQAVARVEGVVGRSLRAVDVQGRHEFAAQELKLGTSRSEWRHNGRRDIDQDERPAHKARLSAYALGTHEVTVQAYRRCQIDGACPPASLSVRSRDPLQPMVGLSWEAATAFCRAVGGRLPTEAEWEAAARGAEGRRYPWGDEAPSCSKAHHRGCEYLEGATAFLGRATPVGVHSAGATPEGIQDMAGNVAEWVQDGYDAAAYSDLERDNPVGPDSARLKVTRGGSYDRKSHELRGARREGRVPNRGYAEVGVRCAWDSASTPPDSDSQ